MPSGSDDLVLFFLCHFKPLGFRFFFLSLCSFPFFFARKLISSRHCDFRSAEQLRCVTHILNSRPPCPLTIPFSVNLFFHPMFKMFCPSFPPRLYTGPATVPHRPHGSPQPAPFFPNIVRTVCKIPSVPKVSELIWICLAGVLPGNFSIASGFFHLSSSRSLPFSPPPSSLSLFLFSMAHRKYRLRSVIVYYRSS